MKIIQYLAFGLLLCGSAHAQVPETNNKVAASAEECAALKKRINPPDPPDATATALREIAMANALTAIELVDRGCYNNLPPQVVASARAEYRQTYLAQEYACNRLKTDGTKCVANDHSNTNFAELRRRENQKSECAARKQAVIATHIPDSASITESQETVMFMTKTILDMIADNCPTESGVTPAQIAAERKQRQQQYAAAESACNAVQSGGRRCVALDHFGPGAKAASTTTGVTPAAEPTPSDAGFECAPDPDDIGRSKDRYKVVAYDPVQGKIWCVNEPESTPPKQNGRRQTSSDWETSTGIRK